MSGHGVTAAGLPFRRDEDWRKRWLVLGENGDRLHRIATPELDVWAGDYDGEWGVLHGQAVCGRGGAFLMPDLFSRLGLPRCVDCCRRLGIPAGEGAPFNTQEEWRNV